MFRVKRGYKHFRSKQAGQSRKSLVSLFLISNIKHTYERILNLRLHVLRFVYTLFVTSSTATGWNQPDRVAKITSTYQTDVSVRQLQSEPHQSALITFSITLVVTFSLARCKLPPCRQALLLTISTLPSSLSLNIVRELIYKQ